MVIQEALSQYKIYAHQEKLNFYRGGGNPVPITVEIHPSNACPHNCIDCVDHARQEGNRQNKPLNLPKLMREVASMGSKAVVFSGGEPLVHKDFLPGVLAGSSAMDVGIITNGQLLIPELTQAVKPRLSPQSWVRISLNADGPEMHEKYHRVSGKYEVIINNIKALVDAPGNVTIGIAFNTSPWTINGMVRATEIAKSLGVNYIQFRPFIALVQHDEDMSEEMLQRSLETCKRLEDESFKVIVSTDKYDQTRCFGTNYSRCHAQQFASMVIAANGRVYVCCYGSYLEKFCLGDTNVDDLASIWKSDRRQQVISELNPKAHCPQFCRFDGLNKIIEGSLLQLAPLSQDELRKIQSLPHVNFL